MRVPPSTGNGARSDLASVIADVSPRGNVRVGGDAGEGTEAAWDVRAGDGEHGEADAKGDEEREEDGGGVYFDVCCGQVLVGLLVRGDGVGGRCSGLEYTRFVGC